MYAEYAKDPRMKLNLGIRRRLAPLLDGGRDEIELMHAILFSLPGSPVLYYGDEIAMGDNVYLGDRDGVRTPMQWTGDRNGGFSRADFAQLYLPPLMDPVYGFQAVNVEAQLRTPTSLLRWLRRFIELRKQHPVFGARRRTARSGPENPRIFAHIRSFRRTSSSASTTSPVPRRRSSSTSRRSTGRVPVEMFGRHRVPADRRAAVPAHARPARLLLVPAGRSRTRTRAMAELRERIEWGDLPSSTALGLLGTLASQRWFGAKSRDVLDARVRRRGDRPGRPAAALARDRRGPLRAADPRALPARARLPAGRRGLDGGVSPRTDGWTIYDAIADPQLVRELVGLMRREATLRCPRRRSLPRRRRPR